MGKLPWSRADSRSWKSCWGLWTASSDSWCQSTIPSLASSQAEAQQMQSFVRQLQEEYLAANKRFYRVFVYLEKAFDRIARNVIWYEKTWCGGVDYAAGARMYASARSHVRVFWGIQWRAWSEGQCLPRLGTQPAAFHHCAWSLVTRIPLWGSLGRTSMLMSLLLSLNRLRNISGGSWIAKKQWRRKDWE